MNIDRDCVIEWPDGTTCLGEELGEMLHFCSDDFVVHPAGYGQSED